MPRLLRRTKINGVILHIGRDDGRTGPYRDLMEGTILEEMMVVQQSCRLTALDKVVVLRFPEDDLALTGADE